MSRTPGYWERRQELADKKLREMTPAQLYDETSHAKDGFVINMRKWYETHKTLSDKQAAVLCRWLAEQELEDEGQE